MSTILNFESDARGFNAYAPQFSTNIFTATLAASANSTITVPSNFRNWIAAFSYGAGSNVWVANNDTATVPAGGTFAAANSELNPAQKSVKAGDILDLITADTTADVQVAFYAIS